MHKILTLKSPSPAPEEPSNNEHDITSDQSKRPENEESVSTKPSEDAPYNLVHLLTTCIVDQNQRLMMRSNSRDIILKIKFSDLIFSEQQSRLSHL